MAHTWQENKILRSLCFLGSICGYDNHNSVGDIVVEAEAVLGQLPQWLSRADLDVSFSIFMMYVSLSL